MFLDKNILLTLNIMIDSLLANINDTDDIDPHYGKLNNTNNDYLKLDVYNSKCVAPLHKYWFKLETSKIISINKNNTTMLKIVLSKTHNINLIKYITTLENKIFEHCKTLKEDIMIKKTFGKQKNYPPILNVKINSSTHIFNNDNKNVNEDYLHINDNISIYFELKNIWINTETKIFWLDLCALQIQTKKLIDLSHSLFDDTQKAIPRKDIHHAVTRRQPRPDDDKKNSDAKDDFKGSFPPKLGDILQQKSKLRSTEKYNTLPPKEERPLNKIVSTELLADKLGNLKTTHTKIPDETKQIVDDQDKTKSNTEKKIPKDKTSSKTKKKKNKNK